ncbi:UNKNOWN [Stylonychia lemnae]|uniref:Uncharacterized protein n=1 Tax=Stylonychia lemnae TaxID=5949 RepID=A0A078AL60_STYLE|nr:UNKNOWN [Stylonychia lemnae]|eukprot:CDW82616.1 UNKNOWN [Stylonychia lemnae]
MFEFLKQQIQFNTKEIAWLEVIRVMQLFACKRYYLPRVHSSQLAVQSKQAMLLRSKEVSWVGDKKQPINLHGTKLKNQNGQW